MITAEEKLAKLREKQAQLKAQEKKIIAQENAKARKARTKRLIEIGADLPFASYLLLCMILPRAF